MDGGRRRSTGLLSLVLILGLFPETADAHLAIKGMGEVGNGLLHPLISPSHVLILLALGLLLGQRVPLDLKVPMLALAAASAAALLLTTTGRLPEVYPPLLAGIALLVAVLVALEVRITRLPAALLCALAAVAVGMDSGLEEGSAVVMAKTLAGTWITLNVVTGYVALCASNGADKPWARTAIRVLGSWIIAISLLVLAFALRK